MKPEEFGIFLSEQRKKNNLTQQQLADKLHVTSSAVSKWERGLSLPDISKFEDIAKVLDLSLLEVMQCRQGNAQINKKEIDKTIADTMKMSYCKGIRKAMIFITCLLSVILLIAAGSVGYQYALRPTKVNYGESQIFNRSQISEVIDLVKEETGRFEQVKLVSVSYGGDEATVKEAEYYNSISLLKKNLTDYMVFDVELYSPPFNMSGWRSGTYQWKWIMVQIEPGQWETLTYGHG